MYIFSSLYDVRLTFGSVVLTRSEEHRGGGRVGNKRHQLLQVEVKGADRAVGAMQGCSNHILVLIS